MLMAFYSRNINFINYLFFNDKDYLYEDTDFYYWDLGGLVLFIIGLSIIIYLTIRFIYPNWNLRLFNDRLLLTLRMQGKGIPPYNHFTGLPTKISPLKMRFRKKSIMLNNTVEVYTGTFPPNLFAKGFFIFKQNDNNWYYFYVEKSDIYNELHNKFKSLFGDRWNIILSNSKYNTSSSNLS
jgi:hypothetical protein